MELGYGFAQRLVLIGTSAAGLLDLKATPLESAMPGVEAHQSARPIAVSASAPYPGRPAAP